MNVQGETDRQPTGDLCIYGCGAAARDPQVSAWSCGSVGVCDSAPAVQSERCIGRLEVHAELTQSDAPDDDAERGDLWVWGTRSAEGAHEIRIEVPTPLRRRQLHASRRDIARMLDALDLMARVYPAAGASATAESDAR
jgi:hypothetical protein